MTRTTTPNLANDLDRVAMDLDRHGVDAVEVHLGRLARHAREVGLASPSVGVLEDATAPAVVRARAFAIVVRHLRGLARAPTAVDDLVAAA